MNLQIWDPIIKFLLFSSVMCISDRQQVFCQKSEHVRSFHLLRQLDESVTVCFKFLKKQNKKNVRFSNTHTNSFQLATSYNKTKNIRYTTRHESINQYKPCHCAYVKKKKKVDQVVAGAHVQHVVPAHTINTACHSDSWPNLTRQIRNTAVT